MVMWKVMMEWMCNEYDVMLIRFVIEMDGVYGKDFYV